MRTRGRFLAAAVLCAVALYCAPAPAQEEATDLDEVLFGEQVYGDPVIEDDCQGRVSVFFIWGIT